MIEKKEMVFFILKMEINMMEIGRKGWKMVKVGINIRMATYFKVTLKVKEGTGIVYIFGNKM